MSEKISELGEKCRAILNTKYRWIGLTAIITWAILIQWMVAWIGLGFYFAIFIAIILVNAFFTIDTCATGKSILFGLVPYLIPIAGFVMIMIIADPKSLQLLTQMSSTEADATSEEVEYIASNAWTLAFVGATKDAPDITWMSFLPLYIIGFVVYAWSDASDRDALKGLATLVLISPIAIQFILGFQYGRSYGLLGSLGDIGEILGYLGGDIAGPIAVIIGSLLDFILVSVLLGIEHAIVEEENP